MVGVYILPIFITCGNRAELKFDWTVISRMMVKDWWGYKNSVSGLERRCCIASVDRMTTDSEILK